MPPADPVADHPRVDRSRVHHGGVARRVQVAVDCVDPVRLAAFWAEALGYAVDEPPDGHATWSDFSRAEAEEPEEEWCIAVDPDGKGPRLLFHRVPEPKVGKNRLHLDFWTSDPRTTPVEERRALIRAEVERLAGLGATHLRTVEDSTDCFAVMGDPEGNEFCIG
jgi:hypothetical protein